MRRSSSVAQLVALAFGPPMYPMAADTEAVKRGPRRERDGDHAKRDQPCAGEPRKDLGGPDGGRNSGKDPVQKGRHATDYARGRVQW